MNTPRNPALGSRLSGRMIAISVSEISDLPQLGLPLDQADRTLSALLLPLISEGARVAYGGGLQTEENFALCISKTLAEAYRRHEVAPGRRPFVQFLAGEMIPVGASADLARHLTLLHPYGEVRLIAGSDAQAVLTCIDTTTGQERFSVLKGEENKFVSGDALEEVLESELQFASKREGDSLAAMRHAMNAECDARVLFGGKKTGFSGEIPGLCEEAILSLRGAKPLFVVGGFGGCSRDIAIALGLLDSIEAVPRIPRKDEAKYEAGLEEVRRLRGILETKFRGHRWDLLLSLARTDSLPAATDALVKLLLPILSLTGQGKDSP